MTIQNQDGVCCGCGKTLSYAQMIFYSNRIYCLDSLLHVLESLREGEDDVDGGNIRVNVSVDLLGRLRDGVLY